VPSTRSAIEIPVSEEMKRKDQIVDEADGETARLGSPAPLGRQGRTRRLALVSLLAALYIAASALPIDAFIGGAGFITAGIILLPVVARLLEPWESVVFAVAASLGLLALQLSVIPVFGFYGMLIPAFALVLGSLGYHKSYLYPAAYIMFGALWYVLFSGGTFLWLAPYLIALGLAIANQFRPFRRGQRLEVVLHSLLVTMCELVTLNIGSISILHLPGLLWTVITPFMFVERTVAVVGATSILFALIRVKGVLGLGEI